MEHHNIQQFPDYIEQQQLRAFRPHPTLAFYEKFHESRENNRLHGTPSIHSYQSSPSPSPPFCMVTVTDSSSALTRLEYIAVSSSFSPNAFASIPCWNIR